MSSPTHAHHRYVIDFGERSEEDVQGLNGRSLLGHCEKKVKPDREFA